MVEVLFNTHTAGYNDPQFWINWYLSCKKDIDFTFDGLDFISTACDPNLVPYEPSWQQTPL